MEAAATEAREGQQGGAQPDDSTRNPERAHSDGLSDLIANWGRGTESLTKIAVVMVGLLYLIGLIVSNAYLARIGLSDFALLRVKCILTGTWTLLLLFVGGAPAVLAQVYVQAHGTEINGIKKNLKFVLCCVGGFILASALGAKVIEFLTYWPIGSVGMPHDGGAHGEISRSLFQAALWVMGPLNLPLVFVMLPYLRREMAFRTTVVLLGPLVVLLAIGGISLRIYPLIGEEFGGGRAKPVALVLNDEGAKFWQQVKERGSYGPSFGKTDQVKLLYQNDSTIVIKDAEEHVLIMDRKLVAGVLPVPEQGEVKK